MPGPDRHLRHRADIEGLRAVAVLLVVLYHAGCPPFRGGFVGVDVFFVLSGFLITGLLADELLLTGRLSLAGFYGRRARRLLPMSCLVLVATAAAFAPLLSPLDRGRLAVDLRSAVLYVANWHFAAASVDYLNDPSKSPALHYWSLGIEEQFYLLWPLLLLAAARLRRGRGPLLPVLLVALGAVTSLSFAADVVTTPRAQPLAYFGLHTRAWELGAGGLLALTGRGSRARTAPVPERWRLLAGWAGLAAVVTSAIVIGADTAFPGWAAVLPVLGTVAVVASGAASPRPGSAGSVLSAAPLTYLGRLSYAWYLWHWPCLIFAGSLAAGRTHGADMLGLGLAHGAPAVAALAVSLGLSVASHHLLEDPVRRSRWLAAARRRSLALGAAVTAGATIAVSVVLPASSGAAAGPVRADLAAAPGRIVLTMTPAQARADRPAGTRDCYAGYLSAAAADDCQFGDPHGHVTLALIGDSHAEQWFPAFEQAALAHHWRLWLWTKSACPFIDLAVRLAQFHDSYPTCGPWRADLRARLAGLPRLDAVVVAHYGGGSDTGRFADDRGVPVADVDLPAAWAGAWARTLAQLRPYTRQVVVLRDVPKPASDVPACIATAGADIRPCSFARSHAFTSADRLYDVERASRSAAVHVLDLDDLLCPGDPCPVVSTTGTIIYRDTHHLTATMSRALAPQLAARLLPLLGG